MGVLLSLAAGSTVKLGAWLGAAAAGLVVLARRLGNRGSGARSRAVVALTQQHALHVVALEGRRFLIGTGPGGPPSLLRELPAEVTVAEPGAVLGASLTKRRGDDDR